MSCSASLSNIFYVVKNIMNIIMIITPIIGIVAFSILLIKMTFNPEEKKLIKRLTNSVSALIFIFFIPMFLTIVMYALGESNDVSRCYLSASKFDSKASYNDSLAKDKSTFIKNPRDYEKGNGKLDFSCKSNIVKSQFSCETLRIVEKHLYDFNYYNFRSVINSYGGFDNYAKSLGGVFAEYYGKKLNIETETEFQKVAEYTFGWMYMYGTDYLNGGGEYQGWGVGLGQSGHSDEDFCPGEMRVPYATNWFDDEFDEVISGTGRHKDLVIATECGPAAQTPLYKGGVLKRGQNPNRKMITRFKDLRPGDIFHIFDHPVNRSVRSSWGQGVHVAIVGEVYDDRIVIYDGGRYFQTTKNFKRTIKMVDTEAEEYAEIRKEFGHDYWASERFGDLKRQ